MTTTPAKTHRFYVRSPDGRAIYGFDRADVATEVALEYGAGAALVDTMAQAYHPMLQTVERTKGAEGARKSLVYGAIGGWDTGRFGVDRDLIEAVKKGSAAIAHAFLAKGASANARDSKGGTALHWAAARGNADVVRLLIDHGAEISARDASGQTARDVAAAKGRTEIVILLDAGQPA